jgi:hypothetical protein
MNPTTIESAVTKARAHASEVLENVLRKSLHDMDRTDEEKLTVQIDVEVSRASAGALRIHAKATGKVPLTHKDDTVPENVGGAQMEMDFDEQVKGTIKKAVKRANRKAGA